MTPFRPGWRHVEGSDRPIPECGFAATPVSRPDQGAEKDAAMRDIHYSNVDAPIFDAVIKPVGEPAALLDFSTSRSDRVCVLPPG